MVVVINKPTSNNRPLTLSSSAVIGATLTITFDRRPVIFPEDLRGDALPYFLDCLNTAQNNGHMAAGVLVRNVDRRRRSRTKVRRKLKKSAFALMTDCGGRIKDRYFI